MKTSQFRQLFLIFLLLSGSLGAQNPRHIFHTDSIILPKKITVGLKMSPPFTMKDEHGNYYGLSIDLWQKISQRLGIETQYKEYKLAGLLKAVEKHEVDLSISPLTVTSDRLESFDFTQPFFTSNLTIAVSGQEESFLWVFISNFFSHDFLKAVLLLIAILLIFGFMLWLAEHKRNPKFADSVRGVGDGFWWAAVTMTTVGYGDKVALSPLGRMISVVWMFTSVIVISSFTASITTALTVNEIGTSVESIADLQKVKVKVGTVAGSSSAQFLESSHAKRITYYETLEEAIKSLADKKIDALIYDEPILRYMIQELNLTESVIIVPNDFNSQYYSFSLPHNHVLLDTLNTELIRELESVEWKGVLNRYNLGN